MAEKPPKHQRIMRLLQKRILRGAYEEGFPSERALAAELGTTTTTLHVALVQLEGLGLIELAPRRRVRVVSSPGSRKGAISDAKAMYARMVLQSPYAESEVGNFWSSAVIYGFQSAAARRGIHMMLEYAREADSVVEDALRDGALTECVGSCILGFPLETRHMVRLGEAAGPVVVVDSSVEERIVPTLDFDDVGAGRLAAERLVKLGHRRIGYFNWVRLAPSHGRRLQGVEEYLSHCGLELLYKRCVSDEEWMRDREGVLLEALGDAGRPIAIAAGCEYLAGHLVRRATTASRRVPDQLSVISLAGTAHEEKYGVDTVLVDHEQMGTRALEMLLDDELTADPRAVLLPVKLCTEAGTSAPPAG